VRTHLSINNFQGIQWNNSTDVIPLHDDDYSPYHATFRPHIIHDYSTNKIFVISPNLLFIWKITAPVNPTDPLLIDGKLDISAHGAYAGSTFHYYDDTVFVGFSGIGEEFGTLLRIDLKTLTVTGKLEFPGNYSNPKAIAGARNNSVYVGFEGGPGVVRVDLSTFKVAGYARLPAWLHNVYAAWDEGTEHVYFTTWEQKTKIFRLLKTNFCPEECPFNGYCIDRKCACSHPFALSSDKKTCALPSNKEKVVVEKGAAIALGILFAIFVILAAAGWFLVWRTRQQGYQSML